MLALRADGKLEFSNEGAHCFFDKYQLTTSEEAFELSEATQIESKEADGDMRTKTSANYRSILQLAQQEENCTIVLKKNSEEFVFEVHIQELIIGQKECSLVTLRNVNHIMRNLRLVAENKMQNLVASSITHEMLTPVRCMQSLVETVLTH